MRVGRAARVMLIAVLSCGILTACTPGIPTAYHVTEDSVDIAFCESFTATSVEIDFGKYEGSLHSIALQTATGTEVEFGDGIPVSTSMRGWEFSTDSDSIPEDWERIDYSFYDSVGEYVGGQFLFRRDVKSSDWAWTDGYNVMSPECLLRLD